LAINVLLPLGNDQYGLFHERMRYPVGRRFVVLVETGDRLWAETQVEERGVEENDRRI
jgi:hypothetical protein